MQLTGKQITERGIISNYCEAGVQQQGVDCRVSKISVVKNEDYPGGKGYIPAEGMTIPPKPTPLDWGKDNGIWLSPGYYEIEFMESCNIPANAVLNFKSRSSLVRCGGKVESGQFDAGFHTDNMGCFLVIEIPIRIDKGTRLAQAIVTETYEVGKEDLYNGQWQGDKQRVNS